LEHEQKRAGGKKWDSNTNTFEDQEEGAKYKITLLYSVILKQKWERKRREKRGNVRGKEVSLRLRKRAPTEQKVEGKVEKRKEKRKKKNAFADWTKVEKKKRGERSLWIRKCKN